MAKISDPLTGPGGAVLKFIGSALFGGFVSLVVVLAAFFLEIDRFWQRPWIHLLWVIPLVWGFLGIFWFEKMLDAARRIFEDFFGVGE